MHAVVITRRAPFHFAGGAANKAATSRLAVASSFNSSVKAAAFLAVLGPRALNRPCAAATVVLSA